MSLEVVFTHKTSNHGFFLQNEKCDRSRATAAGSLKCHRLEGQRLLNARVTLDDITNEA